MKLSAHGVRDGRIGERFINGLHSGYDLRQGYHTAAQCWGSSPKSMTIDYFKTSVEKRHLDLVGDL